jgi:hypothetical protein
VYKRLLAGHYLGYDKFFRGRLLVLDSDQISKWVDQLDKEAKAIKSEALKMVWYMRGGLSYEAALNLSFEERNAVSEIIKDNLETTKKSGLPFF